MSMALPLLRLKSLNPWEHELRVEEVAVPIAVRAGNKVA